MLVQSNVPILEICATLAHKNRHNWETAQNLQAERLVASVIRKLMVAGTYHLCYSDSKTGVIKVCENATMNPAAIAKALEAPAPEEPIDVTDLLRPSTDVRYFDLDNKVWGEFLYEDLATIMLKEELPHEFKPAANGEVMAQVKSWMGKVA